MARGKTSTSIDLSLPAPGIAATKQERAYLTIRDGILNGLLQSAERLPSTRSLSLRWGMARGTLENVFERLQLEGYITRQAGSGSRVSAVIPDSYLKALIQPPATPANPSDLPVSPGPLTLKGSAQVGVPFAARLANPALLNPADWAAHLQRAVAAMSPEQMGNADPQGALPLREQVAHYLRHHRGIACTAQDLIITQGIRHGLDLIARCLLESGDYVCVEDPGYPAAHRIFNEAGASLHYVPVDDNGLCVHSLPRGKKHRLVYVTPAHQSPSGAIMPANRRLELLDWAQQQNAWIIEDDYDSEFNYHSAPLPALKAIDAQQRVIYCGSFNQALFANVRLGYLMVPPALRERLLALWHTVGRGVGISEQLGLAGFMQSGAFIRHLRLARLEYQTLRDIVLNTLKAEAHGCYRISGEHAGFHLMLWLPGGVDAQQLSNSAEPLGIDLQLLEQTCHQVRLPPAFVLGFAALTRAQVKTAAKALGQLLLAACGRSASCTPFSGAKIALLCEGNVLTYQRDDKPTIPWPALWDLPGGGREGDETPEQCALRETREEFGLVIEPACIGWARVYPGQGMNGMDTWFFVAEVPASTFEQIVFGDEGQRWEVMSVAAYLAMDKAVVHFQQRLGGYLQARQAGLLGE